jgi:hypothetical protein
MSLGEREDIERDFIRRTIQVKSRKTARRNSG